MWQLALTIPNPPCELWLTAGPRCFPRRGPCASLMRRDSLPLGSAGDDDHHPWRAHSTTATLQRKWPPTPPSPDLAPGLPPPLSVSSCSDVGVSHTISLENDISIQATRFLGFFDCIHDSRLSFSHRTDAGSGVIEAEAWSIAFRGAGAARCSRFVKDGPPVAERRRRIGGDIPPAPQRPVLSLIHI